MAMTKDRAMEVIKRIKAEASKWLFGLDEATDSFAHILFTLIPYTDKQTARKLTAPGHTLFMGATGVGKTDLCNTFAMAIEAKFTRVQGSPDLMPGKIVGEETLVENKEGGRDIVFVPGPLFTHILLLDEANRMPPKTKAVILEGMEEHSVTIKTPHKNNEMAERTFPLFPLSGKLDDIDGPRFFILCSTQNMFGEEEGTYPTPVAERDRYTFSIRMNYPEKIEDEMKINSKNVIGKKIEKVTDLPEVLAIGQYIFDNVKEDERVAWYRSDLLRNTRPEQVTGRASDIVKENIRVGGSPRVNFHLEAAARTAAFFEGEMVVTPDHVRKVATMILQHRLVLKEGVEFTGVTPESIIEEVIKGTDIPKWKK